MLLVAIVRATIMYNIARIILQTVINPARNINKMKS